MCLPSARRFSTDGEDLGRPWPTNIKIGVHNSDQDGAAYTHGEASAQSYYQLDVEPSTNNAHFPTRSSPINHLKPIWD
ncbi:hypothetical protein PGTUg99_008173 [Puccinia graminis f. sp. tritici]|uniref:Uncharacterized protein n=1 Tax=Puccinia graminis f. sp. tritici TaxID=56615 RepID=A0A5B0NGR3_PUCGR|nr:hypothetical protein PGTUg99_008173 [Puccinia graminis f. sp. tritici]